MFDGLKDKLGRFKSDVEEEAEDADAEQADAEQADAEASETEADRKSVV